MERGDDSKEQGRGSESKKLDTPQHANATEKAPGGWGHVRVVKKVLGLRGRNYSLSDNTGDS